MGPRKFSDFAVGNSRKFKTIIIDWATQHHIRRDSAWDDFYRLPDHGGTLIIPVAQSRFREGNISGKVAKELSEGKLSKIFSRISILEHKDLPQDVHGLDIFRSDRMGMRDAMLSIKPAIIFASKESLKEDELPEPGEVSAVIPKSLPENDPKIPSASEEKEVVDDSIIFKAPTTEEIRTHYHQSDRTVRIARLIFKASFTDPRCDVLGRVVENATYNGTYISYTDGTVLFNTAPLIYT